MNHLKLSHNTLIAADAEKARRQTDAFLGRFALISLHNTEFQPGAHTDGCIGKLLNNSAFKTFSQNLITTVMSCYLRYVDQAAQSLKKRQQMKIIFRLGLRDTYTWSRRLVERILLARPELVHNDEDCKLQLFRDQRV